MGRKARSTLETERLLGITIMNLWTASLFLREPAMHALYTAMKDPQPGQMAIELTTLLPGRRAPVIGTIQSIDGSNYVITLLNGKTQRWTNSRFIAIPEIIEAWD